MWSKKFSIVDFFVKNIFHAHQNRNFLFSLYCIKTPHAVTHFLKKWHDLKVTFDALALNFPVSAIFLSRTFHGLSDVSWVWAAAAELIVSGQTYRRASFSAFGSTLSIYRQRRFPAGAHTLVTRGRRRSWLFSLLLLSPVRASCRSLSLCVFMVRACKTFIAPEWGQAKLLMALPARLERF